MSEAVSSPTPDSIRRQASVVPFRRGDNGPEFCLITTRRSGRWGFPKGSIREHESIQAAALSEALEEAGLTGHVFGELLGQYEYRKRGEIHSVDVMLMHVRHCTRLWKEGDQRERRWVSFEEALELLDRDNLVNLLQATMQRLSEQFSWPVDEQTLRA